VRLEPSSAQKNEFNFSYLLHQNPHGLQPKIQKV